MIKIAAGLGLLTLAVAVRWGLGGGNPVGSKPAALAFTALLAVGSLGLVHLKLGGLQQAGWTWWPQNDWSRRGAVLLGLATAAVLCLVPLSWKLADPSHGLGLTGFATWAIVVSGVAITEETFLRGALWQVVETAAGPAAALILTSAAFALLHVPFYGWGILPLDLAVGCALGSLRMITSSVAAPGTAHLAADLCGWWLR